MFCKSKKSIHIPKPLIVNDFFLRSIQLTFLSRFRMPINAISLSRYDSLCDLSTTAVRLFINFTAFHFRFSMEKLFALLFFFSSFPGWPVKEKKNEMNGDSCGASLQNKNFCGHSMIFELKF